MSNRERRKRYYDKNKGKPEFRSENAERSRKNYAKVRGEEYRKRKRLYFKRAALELRDSYIKILLNKLDEPVTKQSIENKRAHIKWVRDKFKLKVKSRLQSNPTRARDNGVRE